MLADDQEVALQGIDGILVYRDFTDPKIFYCSATRPSVARKDDGCQFTIVLYDPPRDDCAGMLSFVVDLKLDAAKKQKAESLLRDKTPGAQLVEIPWSAGTVVAAIIGGAPVFGVPSLFGSNSVALAVGLTMDQYQLLKNAGKNPQAPPISIVYSLSYEAFRPQYRFSVEFDETRFREWVQKKTSADFLVVSFEKVETFEDLRQSGVIRVVSENDTGETPPEGFQRAFLSSMQSLLEPAPRFGTPPGASGNSWLIGFSSSTVRDIQNISRRLDRNMKVSGAVSRKIFIQGGLDGLDDAMAAEPVVFPTDNPFVQKLKVRCHAAFDAAPLLAANVTVKPRNVAVPLTRVFNKSWPAEWPIELVHAPGVDSATFYRCEAYFDGNRAKSTSQSIEIQPEQAFLDIVPAGFYGYRRYSVNVAEEFPWNLVSSIKLKLRGPAPLSFDPDTLILSPAVRSGRITAFSSRSVRLDDVEFTATYQPRYAAPFALDGFPAGATILLNPLLRRVVRFEAAKDVDWRSWSAIEVEVAPSDTNVQLWGDGDGSFELTQHMPSASLAYWYTDGRQLSGRKQFISADPAAQPAAAEPFKTADAHVTISAPQSPIVTAKAGSHR